MNEGSTIGAGPRKKFQFVGRALCLDFCNTVGGKRGVRPREYLNSYSDFLSWCEQAELIDGSTWRALGRKVSSNSGEAEEILGRAIALRESVYLIFLAIRDRKKPLERDLAALNSELGKSLNRMRVAPMRNGFEWAWQPPTGELDYPLGPIARSAAELLISSALLMNIRQCQGENCGWLFLDSSKNHSRCWCDMRDCGNRAKVRRHRMRSQDKSQGSTSKIQRRSKHQRPTLTY